MTVDGDGQRRGSGEVAVVREVLRRWSEAEPCAALFDFNGTLSDDEHVVRDVFTAVFEERYGWTMSPEHYDERLLGLSDREIAETVADEQGDADPGAVAAILAERVARYRERVDAEPAVTDAAVALVRALGRSGSRLGVVTGAEREEVEHVLDRTGLAEVFGVVVAAADVRRGKPDPEGYLLAAERLGVPPASCLVFEDSRAGVQAAAAAGMTVVAVVADGDPPPAGAAARVPALSLALLP